VYSPTPCPLPRSASLLNDRASGTLQMSPDPSALMVAGCGTASVVNDGAISQDESGQVLPRICREDVDLRAPSLDLMKSRSSHNA